MTERDPLIQVQSNGPQPPMYQMFTQAMLLTRALLPISRSADVWACPLRSCPSSVIGADHILPAQQPALAHWIMAVTAAKEGGRGVGKMGLRVTPPPAEQFSGRQEENNLSGVLLDKTIGPFYKLSPDGWKIASAHSI
jgi:hypothetical protein